MTSSYSPGDAVWYGGHEHVVLSVTARKVLVRGDLGKPTAFQEITSPQFLSRRACPESGRYRRKSDGTLMFYGGTTRANKIRFFAEGKGYVQYLD